MADHVAAVLLLVQGQIPLMRNEGSVGITLVFVLGMHGGHDGIPRPCPRTCLGRGARLPRRSHAMPPPPPPALASMVPKRPWCTMAWGMWQHDPHTDLGIGTKPSWCSVAR